MALVERFPLRPIRGEGDYDRAAEMLDSLVLRDLRAGERDYFDALTLIVEAYDDEHYPVEPDKRPPHERLRSLIEDAGVSRADLRAILGVAQSTVSMILNGQRALSKGTILKLSNHFKLSPAYFL
jgi:HTH-type transcriptional regulator/antitoxin HigA